MQSSLVIAAACAALCVIESGHATAAQDFPTKPIRIIVPFPAGGPVDAFARMLSPRLTEDLGQGIIIDTRSGAGGSVGAAVVAKAPPDGYTVLLALDSIAVNPHVYRNLPFDTFKDLAPVSLVLTTPMVLVAGPKFPADNVRDLVALAKDKPIPITYATAGAGSSGHLATELFKREAGIDMTHVPYKGGAPAIIALIGGEVQVMFMGSLASFPQIKGGKLKALAVTSLKRSPVIPDVPTVAESGFQKFESSVWYGALSAAGTPSAVINRLRDAFVKAVRSPEVATWAAEQGADPIVSTPAEFGRFLRSEYDKWGKVIKEAKIAVD